MLGKSKSMHKAQSATLCTLVKRILNYRDFSGRHASMRLHKPQFQEVPPDLHSLTDLRIYTSSDQMYPQFPSILLNH
jgi:hypothetical protein